MDKTGTNVLISVFQLIWTIGTGYVSKCVLG